MKIASLLVLLLNALSPALADQPSIAVAAHAAASGDYHAAVQNYEQILSQRGFSAPVLFDLGNARLRLGQPARAILEYERALVLAPGSPAIEANLAAARQRAGLAPPVIGPWLAVARHFSFDTYVWAALAAVWVLCAALVLVCLNVMARRIARLLILFGGCDTVRNRGCGRTAVAGSVPGRGTGAAVLHLAPAQSAAANGSLREGEVVWLQERYAGFNFVRTLDGRSGWVSDDAAVPVRIAKQ